MTRSKLIERIKASDHPDMLKAQIIGSIITAWPTDPIMPTMTHAFKMCCKAVGVDEDEVKGPSRKRLVARARHLFFWWTDKRYPRVDVGGFCNRDHTSVTHGFQVIKGLLKVKDPLTVGDVEALEQILEGNDSVRPMLKKLTHGGKKRVRVYYDKKENLYFEKVRDLATYAVGYNKPLKDVQKRIPNRFSTVEVSRFRAARINFWTPENKNKFV